MNFLYQKFMDQSVVLLLNGWIFSHFLPNMPTFIFFVDKFPKSCIFKLVPWYFTPNPHHPPSLRKEHAMHCQGDIKVIHFLSKINSFTIDKLMSFCNVCDNLKCQQYANQQFLSLVIFINGERLYRMHTVLHW